jgi:hypothetical protein
MSSVSFSESGTYKIKEAIGIGLDGVLINPSVNDYKVDIFYPVSWNSTGSGGEV